MHPEDLADAGLKDGDKVRLGSARGVVTLHAQAFEGVRRGVLIAESIWPNEAFEDGKGINTLTGCGPAGAGGGRRLPRQPGVAEAGLSHVPR